MLTARRRREDAALDEVPEHRPARITLLREIKIDSPIHRLWAGTKLLAVGAVSVVLPYYPSWASIGLVVLLLAAAALLARVPRGAWPRLPAWFWVTLAISGGLASAAGGRPHVRIGGVLVGLGGADSWARFVGIGVVLLVAAALLGWTTPLGDIAPAVSRLLSPLRVLRIPVDEAAVAVALCVRSLPLLVDELRTLVAARRLRPPPPRPSRTTIHHWLQEPVDLIVAALAVAMRRAGELAEAISARGGIGLLAVRTRRPGWRDAVAALAVAAVCTGCIVVPVS